MGTRCFVIKEVDLPGYALLVCPEEYEMQVTNLDGPGPILEEWHTVYLYRGSWKPERILRRLSRASITSLSAPR